MKHVIRYLNPWGVECVIDGVEILSIEPPTSPVPSERDGDDGSMMPALWALGHMPAEWGPLPGVGANWAWLLEHRYIERNTQPIGPLERFGQVRITEKGRAILAVRTPGPAALAAIEAPAVTSIIQSFEGPDGGVGLTVHFAGWSGVEDEWAWIELVFREPGKPDRRRRFNYATPAELGALRDLKAVRAEATPKP